MRRLLGALLSFAIVAGAPGSDLYRAAAQSVGAGASEAGSAARAVPALGMSGMSAPVPTLAPSIVLTPSLSLSAPAVAPEAKVMPAAALVAAPVALAPAVEAISIKSVAVAAARPVAVSAVAVPAAQTVPSALNSVRSVAATPEKLETSGAMFDGASARGPTETPVLGGFGRAIKRGLSILALSAGMLVSQNAAHAQVAPLPPPPIVQPAPLAAGIADSIKLHAAAAALKAQQAIAQAAPPQAPAQANPAPADSAEVRAVLPRPVTATASIDRQGVTVGERVHLTFTLKNTSDKPVTLNNLRAAIQDALPTDLELQGKGAEAPLVLAPGESKTITYEAIPFGSGTLTLDGGLAVVPVGETAVYPEGIEIAFPNTTLEVKSVLTPDWKDKGLKDIVGVKRGDGPNWMWLAAIPLGLLLLVGVKRLVDARKLYPKLDAKRLSLVVATQTEIERLKLEAPDLDAASFYARYQDLVTGFMVDFAGLPKAARDARTLERDLHKSFYDAGQVSVAGRLAREAESARFAGADSDAAERLRMIDRLSALVESVAGKAAKPKSSNIGALGVLALLPGAAGLSFGSPWVLLLLIPYAAYVLYSWRARSKSERFAVSSSAQTPAKRTWRERFVGLPRVLRLAAVGLIIVALARPMIGTQRSETFIPSTDTMVSIDLSGSMSGDKLQGVRDAVKAYVEEQRKGTENRVGMVTFSDNSYLDVRLTTDYDALIAHLKELETTGSTAIGKAMLTSIAHFLELNALDLDGKVDPRAATVQKILRDQGLSAALAYAKPYPDLMKKILQPERVKIVVIFTDGDSNTGIAPEDAAVIAAQLGIKVYGVGIAGPNESFNEKTLREVAEKTGAKFYRAGDAQAMQQVLLEISRLEKSPAKIVSSVAIKDYTSLIALLAFLLLGAELTLANTRLRTLYGMALLMGLNGMQPNLGMLSAGVRAPVEMTAQVTAPATTSPTAAVPQEVIDGNKLYNQGRYAEALKKYGEALERHPDVPEIYFNMADAYLRLGENAKAEAAWQKYLSLTSDPKKQSQTIFNLGNSALAAGDAEKALELYKEALRRDAGNQDAKWNLEALKQAQKEQQQQQDKQGKEGKQGKQGKSGKNDKSGNKGDQGKPGDGKPGDGKPGDGKPGQGKPGDGKPGQGKPGDGKPGDGKPQPGDGKPTVKPDNKQGSEKLGDALGEQEGKEKSDALKGMTRKGKGVWGFVPALPLAFMGHGIVFSSTAFLWAVGIGLPVLAVLVAWGMKKRLAAAKKLSPGTAPKTFGSWWGARRFLGKSALALAAVGLIGLAAGDPRGGMQDERVNFGGKDIMVTVDGSYSMTYAEDGRMVRTQKELNEFITRLQGTDRVGLVVFAGSARTASPISIDYGNFEFKINRLDVEARGLREGSDLAGAIKFSANAFETAKKLGDRQRILIVISDGDVPDKEIAAAIAAASEHGITVYAIGVGDPAGTKIKVPTEDGKDSTYLIDEATGGPAITRLNEAPLRQLAERTGGAYFRADGKAGGIDRILSEVSKLEKGQKGDMIKSPSPVGIYFLWPALLLLILDLVLPGRSLLKRNKPAAEGETKAKPKPGSKLNAVLPLALIPLGAWPQILPFAALAMLVAGYLAADSWSGGAITRSLREKWQTWRGVVPAGVAADLVHLYDLRETDERRLKAFVKGWNEAKEPLRETMIVMASHDEALWREKLTAAYLAGAQPETLDKILTALRRAGRARMEPLKPVTDRIAARRGKLAWLEHSEAEARLSALAAAAAGQPVAFAPVPSAPLKPASLWTRVKRGATVATLAVMIALTAVSGLGTLRFQEQQRAAAEMSTKLFYAEDLFVFSDRYIDSRIPEEVLPALKRWTESPKSAGADFDRALTILRESPDPKADNVLVAIFRHSGVLPLTNNGENILLRALIERESDALWASMDALIANSRNDAASAQMLVKLVVIGVESGKPRTIAQVFRVLKSPNKQVQQAAAPILFNYLSRDGASFFAELAAVQAQHAVDPSLQMWTASFAFRRLSMPGLTDADFEKSKAFFDAALVNAARIDAIRLEIYKQTPPDQEVQAPPSLTAMLLGMADRMQGDGGAPAPLAGAARYLVTQATTNLIKEAEKTIPGLHERLIKDGVVLPDTQSSYSYGGGYEDYEGYGHGYRGRGYATSSSTTQNYRETYKLNHLQLLAAAIDELAKPLAENKETPNPAARELLERADAQLESALSAGEKAGMLQGGSAPELAAESLLPVLKAGDSTFSNHAFIKGLRAAELAPSVGDVASQLAYPESLDAAQLAKLHAYLVSLAAKGEGWDYSGKARPMTWDERLYLARAVDAVDLAAAKNFPDAVKAAPADPEQALLAKVAAPGEESLVMVRLALALDANPKDAALALKIEKLALARLAAAPGDKELINGVLVRAMPILLGTPQEAESYKALADALKGPAGAELAPVLRKQADLAVLGLATEAEKAFPDLKSALIDGGLRDGDNSWRTEFKQRHYKALAAATEKAIQAVRKSGKPVTAEQMAVYSKIKSSIPRLVPLAAQAGVSTGDEPGDISAEMVNPRLSAAYSLFPGQTFTDALVKAGLGDPNTDNRTHFRATYTREQLVALRDWLKKYKETGTVEESNGYYDERGDGGESGTRALNDAEKAKVQDAINAAERGIQLFDAKPAAPKSALHGIGFAPFALAALPGIAPWMIFTLVGLGAAYLVYKLLSSDGGDAAAEPRTTIPGSTLARHRRIELSARRMATAVNGGNFRSRFIGAGGTDFAEARPYQGEDMREIDWKTSAKKDELMAKKFELERDMPLMLVIDISRSGRFSTRTVDKRTAIEDAAAVLALAASHSNVRVGAVLVSDRVEKVIPARGGSRHAMSIIDAILTTEPTGSATDLKPGLETAGKLMGSRGMVAVLSDFIAPDFKDALGSLASRHDVRAIRVTDPAEFGPLPDVGLLPVVDAETGVTRMLDTSSKAGRAEATSAVSRREAAVEAAFEAAHLTPISLSTEGDPLESLELAFHPKAKQPFKP